MDTDMLQVGFLDVATDEYISRLDMRQRIIVVVAICVRKVFITLVVYGNFC
jgi:hypothetical protein